MTAPHSQPATDREHHLEWNDRLQDWLDGDLDAADTTSLQAHVADCALCRMRVEELKQLDLGLRNATPRLVLDESFDARIFAQLDAIDESKRAEARRRVEQELQQGLSALTRGWRRALLFVLPGIVAGIAMAFGLSAWLEAAGYTHTLVVQSAAEFGPGASDLVRLSLTTLLGAGLGAAIAGWLASVVD
jgi:anti-sigma factor RsiW